MSEARPIQKEDIISLKDYVKGWLSISWRLPTIIRTTKHILNIENENRESWGSMLEENALKFSSNIAIKSEQARLTYKEYNEYVNQYANYFISQGLKKGDTVAVFLENRPELLILYSAIAKVGAINSMINTNLRQESLLHSLTLNPTHICIVGEEVLNAFEKIKDRLNLGLDLNFYFLPDIKRQIIPDDFIDLKEAVRNYPVTNPATTSEVKPNDTIAYVFTSGTTGGMPKAAVITHGRLIPSMYYNGKIVLNVKPTDTIYVPLPFFHTNALALSWPCIFAKGACVAIRRKFSASNFWDDVCKHNATICCYVGEICRYLMNQPVKSDNSDNPLEKIIGNGLRPDIWKDFKERFGISKVYEIYGAAESNLYFVNILNLDCTVGTCRLPYAIVQYNIDEDKPIRGENGFLEKVDVGETGLLLGEITEISPFAGYTSKAETESKIFREVFAKGDAWFNTGDLVRNIGFGHIQFVDRTGDTFRWKGENVSTTEVEKVADTFHQVSMSTTYGVAMPGGEGRAGMVVVVLVNEVEELNTKAIAGHFQRNLPSYAVPKFIRIKTELEYTATHKIKKVNLKKEGFNLDEVNDPLFVLLPGESAYRPLTKPLYDEVIDGKYKF
jgi:citronellyl-CoA synthetase